MNILLVDDDSYVLEALRKSLDWTSIGIENVYTAQSVNKARKIIADIPIHVLVCDIEMPKENGFELLKWIKEKNYIIQEILLTSYAEFRYATEAIKYGCYAYALKPIDYEELEKMIAGALEEAKKALSLVNHDKYYAFWTSSQKMRKEQFFWDFLIDQQDMGLQDRDFNYQAGNLFLPVYIRYPDHIRKGSSEYGRGMFDWTFNNLIMEVFTNGECTVEAVLHLKKESFLAVVKLQYGTNRVELEKDTAVLFQKKVQKSLGMECSIIIGRVARLDQLQREVPEFLALMKKSLVENGEIIALDGYNSQVNEFKLPDFSIWESFLKDGQAEVVKKEVSKYLDKQLFYRRLDRDVLHGFVTSFLQLLIRVLDENKVPTYQIGTPLFNAEFFSTAASSVTNAKKAIGQMIDTAMNMLRNSDQDKPTVQTVKEYIDKNLDKDITRESLAEMVYLNQDYLARIFKKEIGESIGNYIMGKRVEVAKEYLEKTGESVNSIAIKVGYDNFSYFAKIFKDKTGMTPKEYRKLYEREDGGTQGG
ncbi:MAG TPA: response regulator [Clostridiales bacterium]|nr:response regulator [Clostridiales bacterium]